VLTCREFVEFLDDYQAGVLPPDVLARFDEHLARCPSCVAYARSYQAAQDLARRVLDADALGDVPEELIEAILSARNSSPPS
jgi:anti-sigma factor RsiW